MYIKLNIYKTKHFQPKYTIRILQCVGWLYAHVSSRDRHKGCSPLAYTNGNNGNITCNNLDTLHGVTCVAHLSEIFGM